MTKKVHTPGLILLLSAACLTTVVPAQTSWWRTYGGTDWDEGYSVQQTSDGGYVIVGYTGSFGAGNHDVYLLKTNAHGDTLWTRTYGGPGCDEGHSIQQTGDGGYAIVGSSWSFGAGAGDVYLIKTNAQGDSLWTRTYGDTFEDAGNSVQQTTDGGYIIAGSTHSLPRLDRDAWLVKTNAQGDTQWTRSYGGNDEDEFFSVQQTADGGYIMTGYTCSFGGGSDRVYLVRTDSSGDTLWTKVYGWTLEDEGCSVKQTADRGYVVAGYTDISGPESTNVYVIKTDSLGDTLWTRTYGGAGFDAGYSVQPTTDGGYIIAGSTGSFGSGVFDVYLIKTNASGETLWTRTFGGQYGDEANSVQQTTDGGYIVAGGTYSFGAGSEDVYLIKTDSLGEVGMQEPPIRRPGPTRVLVQPNPFTSLARVRGHEADVFALSDVTGRHVAICKGDRIGEGLRPGVYFLSPVGTKTGKAVTIIKAAH